MKISIIGAGYVGVITGACLAKLGNNVTFVDVDARKIEAINDRKPLIYEAGLQEILNEIRVEASTDYRRTLDSEIILICVGTAPDRNNQMPLKHLQEAASQVSEVLMKKNDYCVVCVRSTVIPGTTEDLIIPILENSGKKVGQDFGLCVSPEFLSEGQAVYDSMHPTRVIIGQYDKRSGDMLVRLFGDHEAPVVRTDLRTAEMIKLASNAFLATKISFMNEIGNICKKMGIDIYEVAKGMGFDERIGSKYLNAGLGYGGSCLPKDLRALCEKAREIDYEPKFLQQVIELNDRQPLRLVELLQKHVSLEHTVVGVLGLAFKPGTNDVRNSSAIPIIKNLLDSGAEIRAYDPAAMENFRQMYPQVKYVTREEVMECAAILILAEWEEFAEVDYRGKIVIDGRRVLKAREAEIYEGICW